jgi:hypothetical protein
VRGQWACWRVLGIALGLLLFIQNPVAAAASEPPRGRSLFDHLLETADGEDWSYRVPVPFTELINKLERLLADGPEGLDKVLIPLGRSLQREAAAPDYFAFPRVVVAVDGQPATSPSDPGVFLRDRLYLGYQEKARVIEVISYNETAGRFEFQVVRNYGPGLTPRVAPAERGLCLSCHQHDGPIWTRPRWEESNSNPAIAERLLEYAPAFHGVPADLGPRGIRRPEDIYISVLRASLFNAAQVLWQEGCGESIDCRADLLSRALMIRLTGLHQHPYPFITLIRHPLLPDDVRLPIPLIANRNPLAGSTAITPELDPLSPRPLFDWSGISDGKYSLLLVETLAEFLADSEIQSIDHLLIETARVSDSKPERLNLDCAFSDDDFIGWAIRVRFSCGDLAVAGPSFEGRLYQKSGEPIYGTIGRWSLGDGEDNYDLLPLSEGAVEQKSGRSQITVSVVQNRSRRQARHADGTAIEAITLNWGELADVPEDPSAPRGRVLDRRHGAVEIGHRRARRGHRAWDLGRLGRAPVPPGRNHAGPLRPPGTAAADLVLRRRPADPHP